MMTRPVTIAISGSILVLLAFLGGRCAGVDAASLDFAERNAAKVAKAYRTERRAHDVTTRRVEVRTGDVIRAGATIDRVVLVVDTVLADTLADVATLRATLSMLRTEVVTYRVTVDSLVSAHADYRASTERALALADSTIAAQREVIKQSQCRILWMRCPTRTATALGAAALTALAITSLK